MINLIAADFCQTKPTCSHCIYKNIDPLKSEWSIPTDIQNSHINIVHFNNSASTNFVKMAIQNFTYTPDCVLSVTTSHLESVIEYLRLQNIASVYYKVAGDFDLKYYKLLYQVRDIIGIKGPTLYYSFVMNEENLYLCENLYYNEKNPLHFYEDITKDIDHELRYQYKKAFSDDSMHKFTLKEDMEKQLYLIMGTSIIKLTFELFKMRYL